MKKKYWIWIILICLILMFVFLGVLPRLANHKELQAAVKKEETRIPMVNVMTVSRSNEATFLSLPGQIQPYRETDLFARTQGYLQRRFVDIGSPVKKGELLATIDAPELDQEIMRAKAEQKLASINLERSRSVTQVGAVAQQDLDNQEANFEINTAIVGRLEALKLLQEIRAPFSGVITARTVEIGAMINTSSTPPLFTISQLDTLRVFIDVPQTYYRSIQIGQEVQVEVPELPSQVFTGQVIRTSGVLRPESRTLLTEVIIPDPSRDLMSGLYGQVNFQIKQSIAPVIIPSNTLVVHPDGIKVVILGPDNLVHYQSIVLGNDYGTEVEIIRGLDGGEKIVTNPADYLLEGQVVQLADAAQSN